MDAPTITAITCLLAAIGAGLWRLINRADKKRARREAVVEELLREQIAELRYDLDRERRNARIIKTAAGKWREQLIAHDITPDPVEWPEVET